MIPSLHTLLASGIYKPCRTYRIRRFHLACIVTLRLWAPWQDIRLLRPQVLSSTPSRFLPSKHSLASHPPIQPAPQPSTQCQHPTPTTPFPASTPSLPQTHASSPSAAPASRPPRGSQPSAVPAASGGPTAQWTSRRPRHSRRTRGLYGCFMGTEDMWRWGRSLGRDIGLWRGWRRSIPISCVFRRMLIVCCPLSIYTTMK